ncbi:MAG: PQQ-dependent sugar dehydrogenase [Planctomycetota bacterium]
MQKILLPLTAVLGGLTLVTDAAAQGIGTELAASGLADPLYVTAPRGDSRLFILEQNQSDIEIYENGVNTATFADLSQLTSTGGERGLLGLAFHPEYDQNGYFFVDYTRGGDGATVVARISVSAGNPNQADPNSFIQLLTIPQPFANHNGGCLQFGPDGYLYISTGDGGAANDPNCDAQNPQSLLGKMLRIDVDTIDATGTYGIPADNPFVGDAGVRDEIYHTGLRNPWRFSFDRATGDMYIGDVGQDAREEVSFSALGATGLDFGWRILEGTLCNGFGSCPGGTPGCGDAGYVAPIFENAHAGFFGGPCSITGGYVYRGNDIPSLQGTYFWTDVCDPTIESFEFDGVAIFNQIDRTAELDPPGPDTLTSVVSFGEDGFGELYIVEQGGDIWKIVPDNGAAPTPELTADWGAISIASGGAQRMTLDSGAGFAGSLYFLAGTTSGTAPGLPFGGFVIPLNLDAYTNLTLANPNSPPLTASLGTLGADGTAQARFSLTGGGASAALAGTTLHHAYVTIDGVGSVSSVSNALALTLAP